MTYQFSLPFDVDTGSPESLRHLAHHNHLLLFQKARQGYLTQFGFSERDIAGFPMVIVEVTCQYKKELFHNDKIQVRCRVDEIKGKVFSMSYSIEKEDGICASGTSKNVCLDPVSRKAVQVPKAFTAAVSKFESITAS